MKKVFAFFPLLALLAACSTAPATRTDVSTIKAPETKTTAPMSQAEMEVREKATWEALVKKNQGSYADMLASDYLEVGDDGTFDKPALISDLKDLDTKSADFSDWKMIPIDKDAVILLYNVTIKGTFKGKEIPPGPYRVCSTWVNRDGKWLSIFYQQTAISAAPSVPPPSTNATPKATASPVASLADAGPDPIANEKLIWEALKGRNYDGLSAFLAPEFVEIKAAAVNDKAGAVKAAEMLDATKAELSEWKTVKLDSDASVVSYLVKLPGKSRQRFSTIWINRNGKWTAILHQGTTEGGGQ